MTTETRIAPRVRALSKILTLLLAAVAAGCAPSSAAETTAVADAPVPSRATRVETLRLSPVDFAENLRLTGAVEALNDAVLAAQTAGVVVDIAAHGAKVEKGAVVARLTQGLAIATVQQAEAQLHTAQAQESLAQDTHDRLAPLEERRVISALEFEQARLQLQQAEAGVRQSEAALAQARVALADTEVRAPFAGTVERRFLDPGERAATGDDLVRLVSVERVKVVAGVPERYSADLRIGVEVAIEITGVSAPGRTGRLSFVGAAIDPQSRTFMIEATVPNPGGYLKPAMLVEVVVPRARHDDVLTVPRNAVVTDEYGPGVFVVTPAGDGVVARRREIALGAFADGAVIVRSGLQTGDEVIVLGQNSVSDGDAVQVNGTHGSVEELTPEPVPSGVASS